MSNKITEGLIKLGYDFEQVIPTEVDFKAFEGLLEDLADGTMSFQDLVDYINVIKEYKIIRYLMMATFYKCREIRDVILKRAVDLGYVYPEIEALLKIIKQQENSYIDLYNKYVLRSAAVTIPKTTPAPKPTPAGGLPQSLKILAQPNAKFCRLVVYDPRYNPPARRHLYLTKKQNGTYRVSLGGATVTSWYNEPFFESVQQAKDFLNKISGVNTSNNMMDFHFCITDKPVASGMTPIISDLSNCVLVDTACGRAYIHKQNSYCVESLNEEVIEENVEKHDELNPALFDEEAKLRPEVKDKINEIVDEFLKEFEEVEVDLEVQDIILTGSNASYNYTKDSDLDIHIVADISKIEDTLKLHKVIYDAYKSSFNKKFEIELNKVPVELYVETQDTPLVSNGIYSVLKDEWVKEPTKDDIPEVDQEAIEKAFKPWEKRYKALIAATTDDVEDESEIDKFIDALYELRAHGLSTDGEYSIENLVFKEMRNYGYLDALKELRHVVIARRLSLREDFNEFSDYFDALNKLF